MESLLFAGVGLIVLGLFLLVIEAFIPSGGVIGIAAGICAIAGVVILFRYDTTWGLIGTLSVLILGPITFIYAMSVLPNTKIGQRMLGPGVEEIAQRKAEENRPFLDKRKTLLHREGIAKTALRPVGIVEVDGERFDAIALGGIIDIGSSVRIVKIDGLQIAVRAIESVC